MMFITHGDKMKKEEFYRRINNAIEAFAIALAIRVFPLPGGPNSSTPLGGLTPKVLKSCGCLRGSSIIYLICAICLLHPPISSYPTPSC